MKQLVSEAASYEHTVTDSVILYPRIDCTIFLGTPNEGSSSYGVKTAILDFDLLTRSEVECLKNGNYEAIDADKVYEIRDEKGIGVYGSNNKKKTVTVSCPMGKTFAAWAYGRSSLYVIELDVDGTFAYWPYVWFVPPDYYTSVGIYYQAFGTGYACDCIAVPSDGIVYADATTPTEQGRNAVFTAEIETGHKFDGWYSDEAYTTLVSSENPAEITTPKYTGNSASRTSLTLYAKAIAGNFYNCTAIAKSGIKSVTMSSPQTASGEQCTFTAQSAPGRKFVGWYSDETCTQLISNENPYTTIILADTTLYAKGTRILYTISVDTVAHCSSSVSPSTAYYEDTVEFQCNPDADYEFVGWYSNEARTDGNRFATSTSVSYPLSTYLQFYEYVNGYPLEGTEFKLWPKIAVKPPTISISITGMNTVGVKIAAVDYDNLSETEIGYLKTGEYDKISASKVHATDSAFCKESLTNNTATATVQCPVGMYISMYVSGLTVGNTVYYGYVENYTWWPYYWYKPEQDASFTAGLNANTQLGECICTAVAKEGVSSADATSPIVSTKEAVFSAEVASGYSFAGWYSDENCTVCVSTENPAKVAAPQESKSGLFRPNSALTLYAKATPIGAQSTGLSLKLNGSWVEAKTVYRKVNGVWTEDPDGCKSVLSQKDRVGTIVLML